MDSKQSIRKVLLMVIAMSLSIPLWAQSKIAITGTVTDDTGEPQIGVSVYAEKAKRGVVTDINGCYKIDGISSDDVLKFQYVGAEPKRVKVNGRQVINETITPQQEISEVVVVGYGTQKKLSVTGSVASVQSKDIMRTNASTTAATLAGKIPGITYRQSNGQPGTTMRMEIRNLGTPLFIIDGVMKDEGQFNNLDINDIESISILKDASAAIYGVKAANGVVLVTTKRGKLAEAPTVSFNAYTGIQNWTRFPKFSNAYDYTRSWSEADINTYGINSAGLTHETLEKYRTGYYDPTTGEDYRSFDWNDFAVRDNAPQNYVNVSATGGSKNTNYYLSISHINQDANFYDFNFKRTNAQLNLDTRINRYLKVGTSMNARVESRTSPTVGSSYDNDFWYMRWGLNRNLPTQRPYANDNEDYLNNIKYNQQNQAYGRCNIVGESDNIWRVFQGNWDIEWDTPLKGLKLKALYSYYVANNQVERHRKSVDFYTYDYKTGLYEKTGELENRELYKSHRTIYENMYSFTVSYENKWGAHDLKALFVAEATERYDKSQGMSETNVSDNFQTLFSENAVVASDSYSVEPTAGFIGRVNYNYADRYLVELAGRYDGSYKMPRSPINKRWGFFPSVSVGWRASEEKFFQNSTLADCISNLKLRASVGQMGDDDVIGLGAFDYLSGYQYSQSGPVISSDPFASATGTVSGAYNQTSSPITNVTWAKSTMYNVGIDLGFLANKLSLELDAFMRYRSGLTATRAGVNLPTEMGTSLPIENLNTDRHMGIDGAIKWNDNVSDFNYTVTLNATLARKKDGHSYGQEFSSSWDRYRTSVQDRWAYVNWGYEVIGRFQTQEEADSYPVIMCQTNGSDGNVRLMPGDLIYKDQNNDGIIDGRDSRPIGYAEGGLPYLTYGLSFTAQWKGFDLGLDFSGATMQTFQQNYETKWPFQAEGNTFDFMVNDRWHHEDPLDTSTPWVAGKYPALRLTPTDAWHNYCNNSTYWQTNVNYLRLRNLEIGYTLPRTLTQKVYLQRARIYFCGTNLFCLDNIHSIGVDPENTDTNGLGYPNSRTYTIGINLTF